MILKFIFLPFFPRKIYLFILCIVLMSFRGIQQIVLNK